MSLTAAQYFDILAPHLSSSEYKSGFLTDAATEVSASYYRQYINKATALLALHNMTIAGLNTGTPGHTPGSVGAVSGIKEGELQVQYYVGTSSAKSGMVGYLDQTGYGQQLKHLMKVANLSATATGNVDNLDGNALSGNSNGIVF